MFLDDEIDEDEKAIAWSKSEQEANDNLADLFAIIVTAEHLERAYARDAISHKEVSSSPTLLLQWYFMN